ncbi:G-protein coupled receptor 15-like [Carcharodon carcharias]|uniref:G-protein coupled receptor 15-like n=1 Tax=Carcharodon carcharias TaxID=13397 RepID=UPI001B7E0DAC|nr:G-protein coupled receptor 15-like [Carcharodon carcharias]
MATADLLVVCAEAILKNTLDIYFPILFLTTSTVCHLTLTLFNVVTSASVWFTVVFTIDRFVVICCKKLRKQYCTETTAVAVISVVSVLSCLINIPWFFAYEPAYIMQNGNSGCVLKQTFFISAEWVAFDLFTLTLTPCVPFILILLLNLLTARRILAASKVRKGLRGCSNGEHHKDSVIESRRKSIILLFSITGSFILLWTTPLTYSISLRVTSTSNSGTYKLESVGFMLGVLSCCINPFIYVLTQAKFREELKSGMKYLVKLCVKLCKLQLKTH